MAPLGRRRWIWPSALLALLVGGLGYAFTPQPIAVDLAVLGRASLAVTVDDDGVTRVREVYVVSAPLAGLLQRVEVHVGDEVVANETVLASIVPSEPEFRDVRMAAELRARAEAAGAARDMAAAELRRIEAERSFARAEFDRTRLLHAEGHASDAALDRARLDLETREAAVQTAGALLRQRESDLRTAQAALIEPAADGRRGNGNGRSCCFIVRAPVSGSVLKVERESAGAVAVGAPLLEIGNPADLEIVVDLLSRDAVRVSAGDAAWIERWGGEGRLAARVRRIEPFAVTRVSSLGIEEQRVNVVLDLTEPRERWRRLGHGYQIDARIVVWQAEDVLQAPQTALFRDGESWAVFRVERGRARLRHVGLGQMNDRVAQVLEGLAPGDAVILHPSDRVQDGVRVERRALR